MKQTNHGAVWSVLDVIQDYARRGPREIHHTGARLIRRNASPWFLAAPIYEISSDAFEAELRRYLAGGDGRRRTGYRFVADYNRLMVFAIQEGYRRAQFTCTLIRGRPARPRPH